MKRIAITPRNGWQAKVESIGFGFHTTNVPYWNESAYYTLSNADVESIENATIDLWDMCLKAVQYVIDNSLYNEFHIPEWIVPLILKSWNEDHPAIYGRFDLAFTSGKAPKMLEFNADTPTSLFEAGIVQWYWLQDRDKSKDQFNSVHEKLTATWAYLKDYMYKDSPLYFTCIKGSLEDLTTTEYLRDCAIQAELETKLIFIEDIGWDKDTNTFVDTEGNDIRNIFKLYPWEFLVEEEFGKNIVDDANRAFWIEPAWKMILSNKALLCILWELFPESPLLLPAYFEAGDMQNYVKKPILSREGANVSIVEAGVVTEEVGGVYGKEGYVYQEYCELPNFDGNRPIIGSWIIGQEPAGVGIREANTKITNNVSRFIPHMIED